MGSNSSKVIDILWFDEDINNSENQKFLKEIEPIEHSCKAYDIQKKGFQNFYPDKFISIITIVSGKLWVRFYRQFNENINKIINIPYVVVFTSTRFKEVLLQEKPDEEHILSCDTITAVKDPFFNPEGVISSFKELKDKILLFKQGVKFKIKKRSIDKQNFEGVYTFEYLKSEEDLLAILKAKKIYLLLLFIKKLILMKK